MLPLGGLIALGWLLRRLGLPGASGWHALDRLLYYVLLPVVLVGSLHDAPLFGASAWSLGVAVTAALLAITALLVLMRRPLAMSGASFSSILQGAVRVNVYIGLPVAATVLGDEGVVAFSLVIAFAIPLDNLISVGGLVVFASAQPMPWHALLARVVFNPLILAILFGLMLSMTGVTLPEQMAVGLDFLGTLTLGLALVAVGAGIRWTNGLFVSRGVLVGVCARQLVLPLFAYALALLLGLNGVERAALMLHAVLPTGPAAYLVARQMGGDAPLMAGIVSASLLFGALTVPFWQLFIVG